jgi:hypothetical protein
MIPAYFYETAVFDLDSFRSETGGFLTRVIGVQVLASQPSFDLQPGFELRPRYANLLADADATRLLETSEELRDALGMLAEPTVEWESMGLHGEPYGAEPKGSQAAQIRQTQNPVRETSCGFKSHLRHLRLSGTQTR